MVHFVQFHEQVLLQLWLYSYCGQNPPVRLKTKMVSAIIVALNSVCQRLLSLHFILYKCIFLSFPAIICDSKPYSDFTSTKKGNMFVFDKLLYALNLVSFVSSWEFAQTWHFIRWLIWAMPAWFFHSLRTIQVSANVCSSVLMQRFPEYALFDAAYAARNKWTP